jgi:hypothetical protein
MNNHAHQHVIPDKPEMHTKFYMEYQKKITDTVRKLVKRKQLSLWERRPSVFLLVELEDAIRRLIYLFLNPVRAGLVETIDDYPGLTTWHAFKTCEASVDAEVIIKAKWTPVSSLEPLPQGNRLSPANDRAMVKRLGEAEETLEYDLIVKPLKWLQAYGITDPAQVEQIRQRIISAVYAEEANLAAGSWEELISFHATPGGNSETITVFLAKGLSSANSDYVTSGEEKDMPQTWVPIQEALASVLSSEIKSPTAVVGIMAYALKTGILAK